MAMANILQSLGDAIERQQQRKHENNMEVLRPYEVQVVSWYDNENSYTSQMVRTIKYFSELA